MTGVWAAAGGSAVMRSDVCLWPLWSTDCGIYCTPLWLCLCFSTSGRQHTPFPPPLIGCSVDCDERKQYRPLIKSFIIPRFEALGTFCWLYFIVCVLSRDISSCLYSEKTSSILDLFLNRISSICTWDGEQHFPARSEGGDAQFLQVLVC